MIADKIMAYMESRGQPVTEQVVQTYLSLAQRTLQRNLGVRGSMGGTPRAWSPSTTLHCGRQAFAKMVGTPTEPLTYRSRMAFLMGDLWEDVGIALARQAGVELITPTPEGVQLECRGVIGGEERVGHCDATLEIGYHGECPADFKGVAEMTFDKMLEAAKNPAHPWWETERWGYIMQVRAYCMMLKQMGRGDGMEGILVAVNKNTGHICEVTIPYSEEDEALIHQKVEYLSRVAKEYKIQSDNAGLLLPWEEFNDLPPRAAFANVIEKKGLNRLPDSDEKGPCLEIDTSYDRQRHGPTFQGFRCGYCDHTLKCFPGFGLVALDKPVYRKRLEPQGS